MYFVLSVWIRENSYWLTTSAKKKKFWFLLCYTLPPPKAREGSWGSNSEASPFWASLRSKWTNKGKVSSGHFCCGLRGHWLGVLHPGWTVQGGESQDVSVPCLGTRGSRRGQQQSGHFLLSLLYPTNSWCVLFLNSSVCALSKAVVQDDCCFWGTIWNN